MKLKILSLLLTISLLSGCAMFGRKSEPRDLTNLVQQPREVVIRQRIDSMCQDAPLLSSFTPRPVEFVDVKDEVGQVWVGMNGQTYENLANNTSDIKASLESMARIINYYRDCISRNQVTTEETVVSDETE